MRKSSLFLTFILLVILGKFAYFFFKSPPKQKFFPAKVIKKVAKIEVKLKQYSYANLPGWKNDELPNTLVAFKESCKLMLRKNPATEVGNDIISMQARDWFSVCNKAMLLEPSSKEKIQQFFENSFVPMSWDIGDSQKGLFTGYYSPLYEGSLKRNSVYSVPIYGKPKDLISINLQQFDSNLPKRNLVGRVNNQQFIPYYSRKEIDAGAIKNNAPVIAWLKNEVDRLFLEIQGAGTIKLIEGGKLPLGYAAENGGHYRSVAGFLIRKGVLTRSNASMHAIRQYVKHHPIEGREAIHSNESFVFFNPLKTFYTPGTQGIHLTAGYSMAVDRKWVPLGVPLWLSTQRPDENQPNKPVNLTRLMIAQDTGGAITGKIRGDVFWGSGKVATKIAGNMRYYGTYWLLLPKAWVQSYQRVI